MRSPKISVVMPHYNSSQTLANAVNSIRNQTFEDWELLIVDDGSSEKEYNIAFDILERFADKRIRLIPTEHKGLVAARNYGNELASADIIAIQDADDFSMPDRLEKCYPWLASYDIVIHGGYRNMWDEQYKAVHREYIPARSLDLNHLKREQYLAGWPVFRKSLWKEFPFRKETQYGYDWMMLIDFCFNGDVKLLDEGLYDYIRVANSASQKFEKEGLRKQSFDKIKEIIAIEYA